MSRAVDGELLAERTAAVLAHLDRVATHLPEPIARTEPDDLCAFLAALRDQV